jgi:hypothetical protein
VTARSVNCSSLRVGERPAAGTDSFRADSFRLACWTAFAGGCARRSGQEPYALFMELLARSIAQGFRPGG